MNLKNNEKDYLDTNYLHKSIAESLIKDKNESISNLENEILSLKTLIEDKNKLINSLKEKLLSYEKLMSSNIDNNCITNSDGLNSQKRINAKSDMLRRNNSSCYPANQISKFLIKKFFKKFIFE